MHAQTWLQAGGGGALIQRAEDQGHSQLTQGQLSIIAEPRAV